MANGKEFACKIPNAGPVSTAERITELPQLGMWRSLMRDATAKIQDESLSLICVDIYGKAQTVLSVPLGEIRNVITRPLSMGSQLWASLGRSVVTGLGVGILILFVVIMRVGGFGTFMHEHPERVPTTVLACLLGGIVLGFLFGFLPNALRTKGSLAEFVFSASGNRVFVLAVEPDREALVLDVLRSVGLNVEVPPTQEGS